jgi:putative membrane protein
VTGPADPVATAPTDDGVDEPGAERDDTNVDGVRLHPLTPFLRGGAFALVILAGILRDQITHPNVGFIAIVAGAVVLVGGTYGLVTWLFTRYRLTDDSLRINTGPVVRRNRVLRYDRMQAVDVNQPLLARLFGLAELRMDVAGGDKSEGRLGYLTVTDARALRARLLARAAGLHAETPTAPEQVVLRVPTSRVFGATLLSTPVVGSLVASLVVLAVTIVLGQPLGLLVMLPWAFGVLSPIARNIARLGGFTLSTSPDGLRTRQGLASVEHQTLPPGRIQGLAISQSLLWRTLGWFRVEVDVAGMGGAGEGGHSSAVVLPVGDRDDVTTVVGQLFGSIDPLAISRHRAPRRARWLRPFGAAFLSWGSDDAVFVSTAGWVDRRINVVPHAKTQSVRASQGPLQRLLGLATVSVDTPVGPVNAVALHRDAAEAADLVHDQVERAHRLRVRSAGDQWMRPIDVPTSVRVAD